MNIASLNRLYATYSTASATPVKAAATDGSSAATQAAAASNMPQELPPLECPTPASVAAAKEKFAANAAEKFRQAGIQVPPEPVLTPDRMGYVSVANDHPDKARIEQLFHEDTELRDQFAEVASGEELLHAVQGYEEYAARYAALQGNPSAQAALVEARIAYNNQSFYITLKGDGGTETFFGGLQGVTA